MRGYHGRPVRIPVQRRLTYQSGQILAIISHLLRRRDIHRLHPVHRCRHRRAAFYHHVGHHLHPMAAVGFLHSTERLHDRDKSAWWIAVFYGLPAVLGQIAKAAWFANSRHSPAIHPVAGSLCTHDLGICRNRLPLRQRRVEPIWPRPASANRTQELARSIRTTLKTKKARWPSGHRANWEFQGMSILRLEDLDPLAGRDRSKTQIILAQASDFLVVRPPQPLICIARKLLPRQARRCEHRRS
jgi:hypothetical protein